MKFILKCFFAIVAMSVCFTVSASADIVSSDTEPTTNVLLDAVSGGTVGGLIDAGAAQGARGTEFTLTSGTNYNVSGFTIQANNADTFGLGENFIVALYTGTAGTFTAPGSFANVTPGYLDTNSGLTLIGQETFAADSITGTSIAGTVANADFVRFNFASDIAVTGGQAITAMVFSNFAFSQLEGNGNGGGRIQFRETSTSLTASGSRDLRFLVHGVAVPEPSSLALLGLAGIGMIARRRRS